MKIIDWFGRIFAKSQKTVILSEYRNDLQNSIALESFALFTTIEMIASLIAKCEFKTYKNGKEFKGYEWYSLNVKPTRIKTVRHSGKKLSVSFCFTVRF